MSEETPKLTRNQCRVAAANKLTPGQIVAHLGTNLSRADVEFAMAFYGIPYRARQFCNNVANRKKVETKEDDRNKDIRTDRVPRVIKVGTYRLRGGMYGS